MRECCSAHLLRAQVGASVAHRTCLTAEHREEARSEDADPTNTRTEIPHTFSVFSMLGIFQTMPRS